MAKLCPNCVIPVPKGAFFRRSCGVRPAQPAPEPTYTPVLRGGGAGFVRTRMAAEGDQRLTVEAPKEPTGGKRTPTPSTGEGHSIPPELPLSKMAASVSIYPQGAVAAVTAGAMPFDDFGAFVREGR